MSNYFTPVPLCSLTLTVESRGGSPCGSGALRRGARGKGIHKLIKMTLTRYLKIHTFILYHVKCLVPESGNPASNLKELMFNGRGTLV